MHANTTKKHNLQGIWVKVCLQNNKIYILYIHIYREKKHKYIFTKAWLWFFSFVWKYRWVPKRIFWLQSALIPQRFTSKDPNTWEIYCFKNNAFWDLFVLNLHRDKRWTQKPEQCRHILVSGCLTLTASANQTVGQPNDEKPSQKRSGVQISVQADS